MFWYHVCMHQVEVEGRRPSLAYGGLAGFLYVLLGLQVRLVLV